VFYGIGRTLQLIALLVMPSAIWVGHFEHNEAGAIAVFLGAIVLFMAGYVLASLGKK